MEREKVSRPIVEPRDITGRSCFHYSSIRSLGPSPLLLTEVNIKGFADKV
jgi:hypothetical protein